jgi:hypothetical protein
MPQTFAAGAAAFLVKDVQKLQPLQQQQQQQQQQIKRPASANSLSQLQSSTSHPLLLPRSDPQNMQPESRIALNPKAFSVFSNSVSTSELDVPWTAAEFDMAKSEIVTLTQVCARLCGVRAAVWCVRGCVVCTRLCGVCAAVWCVRGCVVCARLCGVCAAVWCVRGCVVCARLCGVCTAVWCVRGCVVCARLCGVCAAAGSIHFPV